MIERGVDYNDGNWHGWNGGECPVHPESDVKVVLLEGVAPLSRAAKYLAWSHDTLYPEGNIVAFRVTKQYVEPPKPREFWINEYDDGYIGYPHDSKERADISSEGRIRCIHVREVIEE